MADLRASLAKLEEALVRARPAVARALRPGASKAALAKLPKGAPDLAVWFAWHDGQRDTASLSPDDNRYLLSVEDALDTAKFLAEEGKHWKATWFPLFANGGGDYVALDKKSGALIAYWHDDDARQVVHASLEAWAGATTKALAKLPVAKPEAVAPSAPSYPDLDLTIERDFANVALPKKAALAKAPVGTIYRCTHLPTGIRAQPYQHVYLKLAANRWVRVVLATDADPVAGLLAKLREPPGERPRFWHSTDADTPDLLAKSANRGDLAGGLVAVR